MGLTVGELDAKIKVDPSGFNKGVDQAGTKFGALGKVVSRGAAAMKYAILGIGVGLAAVGFFALKSLDAMVANGDAAYKMAVATGLAKDKASQWIVAAASVGVTGDSLERGFKGVSRNMEALRVNFVATGKVSGLLAAPFKDLGISLLDAHHKFLPINDVVLKSADAFQAMIKKGMDPSGAAMKLFGRSGIDMLPILELGRAGIEKLMKAGKLSGAAMSGPQVDAAHKYALAQNEIKEKITGITTQLGMALMPKLMQFVDWVISTLIPAISNLKAPFLRLVNYLASNVWPAFLQVWNAAKQIWTAFTTLLAPAINYIKDHFNQLKPVLVAFGIVAAVAIGLVILPILAIIAAVVLVVAGIIWFAGKTQEQINQIKTYWSRLVDFVKGIPDKIKGAASGMWNAISTSFKNMLNIIVDAWNGLILKAKGIPILGGVVGNIPSLPRFHQGGTVPGNGDVLAVLQGGEKVTSKNDVANENREMITLLRRLVAAVETTPTHTGVEAALFKAVQGAGMNRIRGMAGA